ncbi:MAG: hypothetical protein HGA36_01485 [Candidatus Moranbacteria bacterium]|nr:hypothetical protein [Candidatus Moranbacteria bacterium]
MKYYFSRKNNHCFIKLTEILSPVVDDVLTGKQDACKKAIQLMHWTITKIPSNRFKNQEYTQQVFDAIEAYLLSGDKAIKSIARKRRIDRLEVSKTIASDCLEYFAFLPAKLEADPENISDYLNTMDNIFHLLRKIDRRINYFQELQLHLEQTA